MIGFHNTVIFINIRNQQINMAVKIFCENIFDDIMPALRAIVANNLTSKYGMTQQEASKKLGLTQPAVSQYKSGLRGKKLKKLYKLHNQTQLMLYLNQMAMKQKKE